MNWIPGKWTIVGLAILSFSTPVLAQNISGKVVDAENGAPIPEALIRPESGELVRTDDQGTFVLGLELPSLISIEAEGYQKLKLSLSQNQKQLLIPLQAQAYDMDAVWVSGLSGEARLLDQDGAISVLGRRELERDHELIITPALNRVPGVFMHQGTLNTNRITIRGIGARSLFSTNKIRAYFDDIPLTSGEGETTLEDLDLAWVDRVEVIRGPGSSLYGAGLGGSINLKSRRAPFGQSRIMASGMVGNFGLQRRAISLQHSEERAQTFLQLHRMDRKGFRENNDYTRKGLSGTAQFYPGQRHRVSLLGSFISIKAFIPSSIDSTTFADAPESAAFTWNKSKGKEDYDKAQGGISWQYQYNAQLSHQVSAFGGFRAALEVRPFNLLRELSAQTGARAAWRFEQAFGSQAISAQLGGEVFREWYDWQTYENVGGLGELGNALSDNRERRQYSNLFGSVKWSPTEALRLHLGLNHNQTQYVYADYFVGDSLDLGGSYTFVAQWSPRLALRYRLNRQVSIHGSASHGFSPPSLSETLTPDGSINPDIQPETGWNFEWGMRGRIAREKLFFDFSIYALQVRNLLVARRTGNDAFVGINAGKSSHPGLELALDYSLIESSQTQANLFLSYTFTRYRFTDFVDGEDDFSGQALPGIPPHHLNAGIDILLPGGLSANLSFQYVDAMPMRDDNSVFSDAYALLHSKVTWRNVLFRNWELELYGGVNNLLDTHYASMILVNAGSFGGRAPRYYYPGAPRNAYLGLKLAFLRQKTAR